MDIKDKLEFGASLADSSLDKKLSPQDKIITDNLYKFVDITQLNYRSLKPKHAF